MQEKRERRAATLRQPAVSTQKLQGFGRKLRQNSAENKSAVDGGRVRRINLALKEKA